MHYCVITGGPLKDEALSAVRADHIICADGGTDFACKHSIIPELVVGDLDSITQEGLSYIEEHDIPVQKLEIEKDWTDTEIALNRIPDGSEVTIVCPLGINVRLDHVIGNIQLAAALAGKHKRIVLTDGITRVFLMSGKDSITVDLTQYEIKLAVSLVPLSFDSSVKDVTTTGLYYSLNGGELIAGKTYSFCNHPVDGASEFSVSIGEGILAVIVTEEA
ncbi:MAG: thiamine diphosphokinase [Clostridiales bacterium]|nr:thiamine diphosphokinase [Clostridiales bacterium]